MKILTIINNIKNKIAARRLEEKLNNFYNDKTFKKEYTGVSDATGGSGVIVELVKRLGLRNGDVTSKDFEEAEYDLSQIDLAYEADSYARQGLDKYLEQIFKEGFDFYSKNEQALEYIKLRLLFIAEATKIPTEELIGAIAEDVVKYSNAIVLKARKQDESQIPQGCNVTGIDGKEPVVGYFPAHPATFKVKRDKTGLIQGWQQEIEGADKPVKFKAEDVIHIPYKRKRGNAFGTPFIISVLNDIKALRFLEEQVINMVYKHTNPFIHVKVGNLEAVGTKEEIDDIKIELDSMNPEDGFVSTNRVELVSVNTNNAVDARVYLDYYEQRVFSGIGVPGIAFGRGGTANRSTADAMTAEMSDRIKAIKTAIQNYINADIIKELLFEGGFDVLTNPDDMVFLRFRENDLDKKIKYENHCTFLFEHNVITEEECRIDIGRDPITDRAGLYHELYTLNSEGSSTNEKGNKDTNNKNKPTNQSGTKASPKKNTNSTRQNIFDILNSYDYKDIANILNVSEMCAKHVVFDYKRQKLHGDIMDIEIITDRIKYLSMRGV